uniref:Uncharacterized protein n=1 Tax=Gasterosteus aculeatus TaxID=69293 RepID=G3PQH2_GASAC
MVPTDLRTYYYTPAPPHPPSRIHSHLLYILTVRFGTHVYAKVLCLIIYLFALICKKDFRLFLWSRCVGARGVIFFFFLNILFLC